ncbi:MAG: leucine-rich repeat domain-containing protein, partial [Candidatus Poribacteria bacterium]|nr:leucine-rich repeat domain-containing protein [Candidatus Poribacteria bacterium]
MTIGKIFCKSLWIQLFLFSVVGMFVYNAFVYAENEEEWMPDPALREAIREKLKIPADSPLTQAYMQEHLTALHVSDKGIVNLTGLEHATDLQSLGLARNKIQDLSPLSGLTGLGYLNLGSNQISDLRPLAGLTRLEFLHLWGNQIKDISPLAGLVNLKNLNLSRNQIADISA